MGVKAQAKINGSESKAISAWDLTAEVKAEVTRCGYVEKWVTSAQIWQLLRGGHSVEAEIKGSYIYVRLFNFRPAKGKPLGVNPNTFGYFKQFLWPPVLLTLLLPVKFTVYATIAAQIQSFLVQLVPGHRHYIPEAVTGTTLFLRYTIHIFI